MLENNDCFSNAYKEGSSFDIASGFGFDSKVFLPYSFLRLRGNEASTCKQLTAFTDGWFHYLLNTFDQNISTPHLNFKSE